MAREQTSIGGGRRRKVHFRTLIALTMLLVAALGAGVAGWAAILQQSASQLERRVSQAQMLELSERQQLLDASRTARALQERLERHLAESRLQRRLAQELATSAPAEAALAELRVQEAMLIANLVRPLVDHLPNVIADDLSADERRIGLAAASSLQRKGLQASWLEGEGAASGGSAPPQAHVHYKERDRFETLDTQALRLALVVVAFVAALVLLTLADLAARRHVIRAMLFGLALAVASAATAAAVLIDASLSPLAGGIAAAFLALVVVSAALGWLTAEHDEPEPAQAPSIDSQGFAGTSVQTGGASQGFTRLLIVCIALAALQSAVVGYWYAGASSQADDAGHSAYEQQLDLLRRSARASIAVGGTFEGLADLYESRQRCQAARHRTRLVRDGRLTLPTGTAEAEERLRCPATGQAQADSDPESLAQLDRRFGPAVDPRFPVRLMQHLNARSAANNAAEPLALWDGYNEVAAFWSGKTTALLACLTILAIALYVFGQAVGMGRLGVARAMAACGILMALGSLAWSLATWARAFPAGTSEAMTGCALPEGTEPDPAARPIESWLRIAALNFATGMQELQAAEEEPEFGRGLAALECAISARPKFAMAHNELAAGKALSQSAHKGQSYFSLPTRDRLDEILRNSQSVLRIQQDLGFDRNSFALNSSAVAHWWIGIRDGRLASIEKALTEVDEAIAIGEALEVDRRRVSADPERNLYPWLTPVPLLHLNRSLFLIATDRIEEARSAALAALDLQAGRDWTMIGTMLTATRLLETYCDPLHGAERCRRIRAALEAYRRALLTGAWPAAGQETAGPPARSGAVAASVNSSVLTWVARLPAYDPEKDRLTAVWNVLDGQWSVPDVLSQLSPVVARGDLRALKEGAVSVRRDLLTSSGYKRCLPAGRYAVELAINGVRVGVASAERKGPEMSAARLDGLNLALCRPRAWKPWQPAINATPPATPMAGFVTAASMPAAFVFALPLPEGTGAPAKDHATYALDRALEALRESGMASGEAAEIKARVRGCDAPEKGAILQAVARPRNAPAYVVLVMADAVAGQDACEVLNSVTIMQRPPA